MKKFACVLLGFLLFAAMGCSGGGGATGASGIPAGAGGGGTGGTGGGGEVATGPVGTITVRISGPAARVPLKADAPPLPDWDEVRIIAQQEFADDEGNMTLVRRGIGDLINGGQTSLSFTVPAAGGYTVVALFSTVSGSTHTMLAYGKSDPFTVNPGEDAGVSVAANPIYEYITILPPLTVNNNQTFNVGVFASGPVEQYYYRFKMGEGTSTGATPFTDTYSAVPNDIYSGIYVPFTAPNKGSASSGYGVSPYANMYSLHFQGQFFANSSVLDSGELATDWTFTCPNYTYNDPVLTHLVPDGGIVVDITY